MVRGEVLPDITMDAMDRKTVLAAPALKPPPIAASDFVNPYSTRKIFIPASAVCVFLSTVFVMIRIGTKIIMKWLRGWDDCNSLSDPKIKHLPLRLAAGASDNSTASQIEDLTCA